MLAGGPGREAAGESENIRKTREAAEEEWNQLFSHLSSWQAGPRTAG